MAGQVEWLHQGACRLCIGVGVGNRRLRLAGMAELQQLLSAGTCNSDGSAVDALMAAAARRLALLWALVLLAHGCTAPGSQAASSHAGRQFPSYSHPTGMGLLYCFLSCDRITFLACSFHSMLCSHAWPGLPQEMLLQLRAA